MAWETPISSQGNHPFLEVPTVDRHDLSMNEPAQKFDGVNGFPHPGKYQMTGGFDTWAIRFSSETCGEEVATIVKQTLAHSNEDNELYKPETTDKHPWYKPISSAKQMHEHTTEQAENFKSEFPAFLSRL